MYSLRGLYEPNCSEVHCRIGTTRNDDDDDDDDDNNNNNNNNNNKNTKKQPCWALHT